MQIRHSLIYVTAAFCALVAAGCATPHAAQAPGIQSGTPLLPVTNAAPGSTCDVQIYVIEAGDSVAQIARKFQITVEDLEAMNPDLNPTRIKIGQKLKVYECLAH